MLVQFIKKHIRQPEHLSNLSQQDDSKKFKLLYGSNPIGYLGFKEGLWHFEYSEWFKNQDRIVPLLEFPDKDKKYRANELWSFFSSRIPSKFNIKSSFPFQNQVSGWNPPNYWRLLESGVSIILLF